MAIQTTRLLNIIAMSVCLAASTFAIPSYLAGQQNQDQPSTDAEISSHLLKVPLPIDSRTSAQVRQNLQQIADSYTELTQLKAVVILEFDNSRGATGQGSSLGACIDLARFLSGKEMNQIKTVAYVPARKTIDPDGRESLSGRLVGHAVLVALSADQLEIHPDVTIGSAGIDESVVDGYITEAYRSIVANRLNVPVPVALSMLDSAAGLYRTETNAGRNFVNKSKLKELESAGDTLNTDTLAEVGDLAELSGNQLLDFKLIRHTVADRTELADKLGIKIEALQIDSQSQRPWQAVLLKMPQYIDRTTVQWVLRAIEPRVAAQKANLLIIEFDSVSGDAEACAQLAQRLVSYDSDEIRTVGFIRKKAAGAAAMLALSCDHLVMRDETEIGGPYEPAFSESELTDLKSASAGLAEKLGKDPALLQAMLDPDIEVIRFRDAETGRERLLTQQQRDELADADRWQAIGPLSVNDPISAEAAQKFGIARQIVSSFDELKSFYQLDDDPEMLTPSQLDRWLHKAAVWFASPFVAPWLLFLAMFCLFNEFSQPGLGVPGFLGAVCLMLYFWSQHLDGNANWLEIMMFGLGVIFIAIELFVVPGFGIFGIGGLIMVVASIVLAAQTFVFPTNTEEFRQLPRSLFALLGAFAGLGVGIVLLGTVLPKTPFFKRLMLEPPSRDDDDFPHGLDPESVANLGHLLGKTGVAITDLAPTGKARLAGELIDVVSDGPLIEKDQAIEAIEVTGNRVVVAPV